MGLWFRRVRARVAAGQGEKTRLFSGAEVAAAEMHHGPREGWKAHPFCLALTKCHFPERLPQARIRALSPRTHGFFASRCIIMVWAMFHVGGSWGGLRAAVAWLLPEKVAEREPTGLARPACMSGRGVKKEGRRQGLLEDEGCTESCR